MIDIKKNIKHYRKSKNLTQGQLSKISKVPRSTIANYESSSYLKNGGEPSFRTLKKLAIALKVTIKDLVGD